MADTLSALTEKEKETLRLIGRGHDAKSAAIELDLSVHTINERLRNSRRKLDVTSSREAARILIGCESEHPEVTPENLGYKELGDANGAGTGDPSSINKPGRRSALVTGGIAMSLFALTLALAFARQQADNLSTDTGKEVYTSEMQEAEDAARKAAARKWLALVDKADWQASYDAAGSIFRDPNTVASWRAASEQVRTPLGDVVVRDVVGIQIVASPEEYEVVVFRTDFENRENVTESVTLQREGGELRAVGYSID